MSATKRTLPRYKDPGPAIVRMSQVTETTACRVCRSATLWPFFSLGDQPLANDLVPATNLDHQDLRVPLALIQCQDCLHVQLTHTVPARVLFANYRYLSGISVGWHEHCERLSEEVTQRRGTGFVVDIGANDGTLLTKFKRLGWKCLGVDPATAVARTAPIRMECTEWSQQTAATLAEDYHKADVIIAQNVLGHVDDPGDFMAGIKTMLRKDGEAIIEVPDVLELIKSAAFDTIYHEHLSYWSIVTLVKLAAQEDMVVTRFQRWAGLHGGTIRVYVKHRGTPQAGVGERLIFDHRLMADRATFANFQERVDTKLAQLGQLFTDCPRPFWGYSAPAKATVLLNALHDRGYPMPEWIVEDSHRKQDWYVPGVRVPIVRPEALDQCQTLVVFAWNWAEAIKGKAKKHGFVGKYLIPLPEPRLEDG